MNVSHRLGLWLVLRTVVCLLQSHCYKCTCVRTRVCVCRKKNVWRIIKGFSWCFLVEMKCAQVESTGKKGWVITGTLQDTVASSAYITFQCLHLGHCRPLAWKTANCRKVKLDKVSKTVTAAHSRLHCIRDTRKRNISVKCTKVVTG